MNRFVDVGTSIASSLARLASGASVGSPGDRPVELLEIYAQWEALDART